MLHRVCSEVRLSRTSSVTDFHSVTDLPAAEAAAFKTERRQEALRKFQAKKRFRSFEKKILYDSRKQVAEQRPRVLGKFMRIDQTTADKEVAGLLRRQPQGYSESTSGTSSGPVNLRDRSHSEHT